MVFGLLLAAVLGSGPVAGGGSVAITTADANQWVGVSVDVQAWDQPTVRVEQEPRRGDASLVGAVISHDGEVTTITAQYRGDRKTSFFGLIHNRPGVSVRWIVHVPATAALKVTTANGSMSVSGVTAALDLHSSNGNIIVTGAGSTLTARSSNGNVEATVATLNGAPRVEMRSSNGNIALTVPSGFRAKVSAGTSNGKVRNSLPAGDGSGTASLHTSNGDITVTVSN